MHSESPVRFLVLIVDRKKKNTFLTVLENAQARLVNLIYARGSVKASSFLDALGFVPEEQKVVMTCLLPAAKADAVLNTLLTEHHFNQPNTGFAFTIMVEGLSY
jgi:hypothetical protein